MASKDEEKILRELEEERAKRLKKQGYERTAARRQAKRDIEQGVEDYVADTKPAGTQITSSPIRGGRSYGFIEPKKEKKEEIKLLPPAPEKKLLGPARNLLPPGKEQKLLPPGKEQKLLGPARNLLPPGPEPQPRQPPVVPVLNIPLRLTVITEPIFTRSVEDYIPYRAYTGKLWISHPGGTMHEFPITRSVFPRTAGREPGPEGANPAPTRGTFLIPLTMEPIPVGYSDADGNYRYYRYRIDLPAEFSEAGQPCKFLSISPHPARVHYEEKEPALIPSGYNQHGQPIGPFTREHGGRIVVAIYDDLVTAAVRERDETGQYMHVKITAKYSPYEQDQHKNAQWTTSSSTSAYGTGGTSRLGRAAGMPTQLASMKLGTGQDANIKNVSLTAAVNTGRKELHDYGEVLYNKYFTHPARGLVSRFQQRADDLRNLERAAHNARATVRRIVNQQTGQHGGVLGTGVFGAGPQKLLGEAQQLLESNHGMNAAQEAALREATTAMNEFYTERDNYAKQFEEELEKVSATLKGELKERAATIATILSRKYKIPLRSDTQEQLKAELEAYAEQFAEELITRGNTRLQAFFRGLKIISREGQTAREMWLNLLANFWGIATGPWVAGTATLLFMYLVIIFPFSGEAPMLITMGVIGAVGVFLLNAENVKAPLDFLTHIIAGGMIGGGTGLFLIALVKPFSSGFPGNLEIGGISGYLVFGMIWFLLALLLGAFQFYNPQSGGYTVVFQMTVLTIVFAYFALGPYNGYYKAVMNPVGSVVVGGFGAVKGAFLDVWLLGTNPTEWYARQQLKNVRPEKPLDYVKGVEIEDLVVIPDSVPASEADFKQEFSVVIIVNNRGDLPAKNIGFSVECNDYCDANETHISEFKRTLEPGEGDRVQFTNLFSYTPDPDRSAEFQLAKVDVFVSYEYETSSSLNVEIMSKEEINRRQFNQENVYHAVTAVSKSTPAQISLNVGPQPLTSGTKDNRLLVAVLSDRQDGTIVLPAGTEIKLSASRNIIDAMRCTGCQSTGGTTDRIETTCTVPRDTEVKYNEFKSIFAFNCDIDTANTAIARSDIITAEMPQFTFKVKRSKDIAITPPLRPPLSDANKGLLSNADQCKDNQVLANRIGKDPAETYNKYGKYIDSAVSKYLTDISVSGQALVAAMITQESTWNEDSVSSAGAIGLMQVMPVEIAAGGKACQQAGIVSSNDDLRDPEKNIECGTWFIGQKIKDCGGSVEGGLTAYYSNECDASKYDYDDIIMGYYNEWQKCIKFATVKYDWPVEGSQTVSGYCFGDPSSTSSGGVHKGIDIAGSQGDAVLAIADGVVDEVIGGCVEGDDACGGGLGNHVVIEHNDGRFSRYAHMERPAVEKGILVRKGDIIGTVGNTGISSGPHLHFEIWNEARAPINPCDLVDCTQSYCKGGDGTGPVPTCAERFPGLRCYKGQLCAPGTEKSPAGTSCEGAFSGDGICCRIG